MHNLRPHSLATRLVVMLFAATALVAAPMVWAPAAGAADDPPPVAGRLSQDQARALAVDFAKCDPSGSPTSADAANAATLNGRLQGALAGAMTAYRASCARMIVQTVRSRGLAERAGVIAITTAIVESGLRNYATAVDHDSLGLFQQRPSAGWGSPAQLINPVYATNAFLNRMLQLYPNGSWRTAPIGEICQAVQVSAFPERYQPQASDAQIIVDLLWSPSTPEFGLAGGPAVTFGTSLQYFAVGNNTNLDLYSKVYQLGESWRDWAPLYGNIRGKPSVVQYGDTLQIYVRGTDNHLYQQYWSPRTSWSGWIDRGGYLASDPVAIVYQGNLQVFARNGSGNLMLLAYDSGGQGWLHWQNLRGVFVGKPSVVNYGTTLQIYVRTAGNNLYQKYYSPGSGWSGWISCDGSIASDPATVVYQGNLQVFARGTNNSLHLLAHDSGRGWLPWNDLGGGFVGKPSVISYGTSLQIFVRSIGNNLYSKFYSPGTRWSGWNNHRNDGPLTSDPVTVVYQGNLQVFARNDKANLTLLAHDSGHGWVPWDNLGGNIQ